jgi:Zn-finger nucleic acid-binding protein
MDCVNCGAPLPPKSNICKFCSTLNDTDLRAIQSRARQGPESTRDCPRCRTKMQTIALRTDGRMMVERCEKCLGIFFDPGELEGLIDASVSNVHEVDHERMETLLEEEIDRERSVTYVPCPDCGKLMNRKNYGARAGVIVDVCKKDGIWLDGGELGALLKWVKAGGKLHHRQQTAEEQRLQQRSERQKQYLEKALQPRSEYASAERRNRSPLEDALGALLRIM